MKSRYQRPRKGSVLHYLLTRPLAMLLTAVVVCSLLVLTLNVYLVQNVHSKELMTESVSDNGLNHNQQQVERGQVERGSRGASSPVLWLYHKTV